MSQLQLNQGEFGQEQKRAQQVFTKILVTGEKFLEQVKKTAYFYQLLLSLKKQSMGVGDQPP